MKKVLRLLQSWSHTPDRMEKFSPNQKKKIGGIAPSVIFSWLRHYLLQTLETRVKGHWVRIFP